MAKVIYEKVENPTTSDEWDQQVNYLKQQLSAARKAQKNAEKQEQLQREEEERRQQIADAMELVDFMKVFTLNNGSTAYEWMTAKLKEEKAQGEAAESAEEVEDSEEGSTYEAESDEAETDEDEAEETETENHQYYQQSGYYNN